MPRKSNSSEHQRYGEPVRLQVYISRAGIASRRGAEELVAQGRVTVNGARVTAPGTKVAPGRDRVEVDGKAVEQVGLTWLALHKPKGYVTSRRDTWGRPTVYDLLPEKFQTLFHVGRLDRDSEGLLLMTNDGEGANRMLHPRYGITKEYLVDVEGQLTAGEARELVEGVELEEGVARAESVDRLHKVDEGVFRVRIVLREGKKREVRRMMETIGHPVRRLVRRRFGPVELAEMKSGKWRLVSPAELSSALAAEPRRDARPHAPAGDEARGGEAPPRRRTRPAGERPSTAPREGKETPKRPARREGVGERVSAAYSRARSAAEGERVPARGKGAERGKPAGRAAEGTGFRPSAPRKHTTARRREEESGWERVTGAEARGARRADDGWEDDFGQAPAPRKRPADSRPAPSGPRKGPAGSRPSPSGPRKAAGAKPAAGRGAPPRRDRDEEGFTSAPSRGPSRPGAERSGAPKRPRREDESTARPPRAPKPGTSRGGPPQRPRRDDEAPVRDRPRPGGAAGGRPRPEKGRDDFGPERPRKPAGAREGGPKRGSGFGTGPSSERPRKTAGGYGGPKRGGSESERGPRPAGRTREPGEGARSSKPAAPRGAAGGGKPGKGPARPSSRPSGPAGRGGSGPPKKGGRPSAPPRRPRGE